MAYKVQVKIQKGFWSFRSDRIESESVIRLTDQIISYDLTFGPNQYQIESLLD